MSGEDKKRRSTLADALDATEWDYKPGKDPNLLLRPVGAVFGDLPWEYEPQYLGPAPISESEVESESDAAKDTETRPIETLEE
jgi:hypothetical protein